MGGEGEEGERGEEGYKRQEAKLIGLVNVDEA